MYTIALFALLASTKYAVEATSAQLGRRQSSTPVALWGACNYPSQGINGPLPCADGAQCICKDDTYAQCRTELDGSWTPPGSSWQCQKPGDTASGGSSDTPPASGGGEPSDDDSTCDVEEQTTPVATNNKLGGGEPSNNDSTDGGNPQTTPVASNNEPGNRSESAANRVGSGEQNVNKLRIDSGPSPIDTTTTPDPGAPSGPNTDSAGGSQVAKIGGCGSTSAPGGWDGTASISYYGWMGSACNCGEKPWQWAGSAGIYSGAVNQKLFAGTLNSAGQPNCGAACGQCYELSTSGFNAYNDGVGSGSSITLHIVDACFSHGDHWCGSTSDGFKDSSDCAVHFDIQTGPPGSAGGPVVGRDGKTWNGGGQIVYYKPTACPQTLTSNYNADCKCN